ncbi:MAG TPA: ATP-binding protein [Candidatus Eisenbacteria bacterium]|nr:ATP-binding protein [Candidatus Eisenbacteria bacterium]
MARSKTTIPRSPDFRVLFESSPGLYLVLKPDLTIVAASDAYLTATMTRRDEILGRGLFEVFPGNPDDPEANGENNLRASLSRVLALQRPDAMAVQKYDIRRPEAEGGGFEERYWSPVNSPVIGKGGKVAFIIHRVEDVTDFVRLKQQKTEEHRLAEELRSRAGLIEAEIFRRAQEIQDSNKQLRELQEELEQRVLSRTADLQRANEELQREMVERRRMEEALRASEEQLRQAQKMEAIGTLAGGVAHDFNNLLTTIMGYSQLLAMRLTPDDPSLHDMEEIIKAATRASMLTRQLLAFSRREMVQPRLVDLNAIVSEMGKMLRRLIGESIDLVVVPAENLGAVKADAGHVEQVLMNLSVNARDAMPDGGRLTIETSNIELGEGYAGEHIGVSPGQYVLLVVSDTGSGMDPQTKARMFEPFFTTKGPGKGTGLGLSTVYGIVKQWGGSIEVYTDPSWGTTFKIYFPRAAGTVEHDTGSEFPVLVPRGSETVLLVEDQDAVAAVIRAALQHYGYQVLEARQGGEALALLDRHGAPISIVVTDVVMPVMGGPELAKRLWQRWPETKVLFMSGYTERAFSSYAALDPRASFLQKPFMPESLALKVREMLDGSGAAKT